jgi:hypothetical protein
MNDTRVKIVFWHRELPPLKADLLAEHTVEANSSRVPGTLAHRDELWDQCYRDLMMNAESRIVQEVTRLGGHFAHVHDEAIHPKHDDATGEAWLHGRFSYMLYGRPSEPRYALTANFSRWLRTGSHHAPRSPRYAGTIGDPHGAIKAHALHRASA